jgi:nicotinamidase/pyrazinamidase
VPDAEVISKGTSRDQEAYSGFQGTDLAARLRNGGIRRVLVGGLATDYCVKATVEDAIKEGFAAVVLADAVRAVDLKPGDGDRALEGLERAGAGEIRSQNLRLATR